jgi:hypothetical protein
MIPIDFVRGSPGDARVHAIIVGPKKGYKGRFIGGEFCKFSDLTFRAARFPVRHSLQS